MSLSEKQAVVDYNSDLITIEAIADAIEDMGFDAHPQFNFNKADNIPPASASPPQTTASDDLINLGSNSSSPRLDQTMVDVDLGDSTSSDYAVTLIGVEGMHCKSCVKKIQDDLITRKGVHHCSVSLDKKLATVKYDSDLTSVSAIATHIANLSFTAIMPDGKTISPQQEGVASPAVEGITKLPPPPSAKDITSSHSVPTIAFYNGSPPRRKPKTPGSIKSSKSEPPITHPYQMPLMDDPSLMKSNDYIYPIESDLTESCVIHITGMTCASCVNNIERNVG